VTSFECNFDFSCGEAGGRPKRQTACSVVLPDVPRRYAQLRALESDRPRPRRQLGHAIRDLRGGVTTRRMGARVKPNQRCSLALPDITWLIRRQDSRISGHSTFGSHRSHRSQKPSVTWTPSERAAHDALDAYLNTKFITQEESRNGTNVGWQWNAHSRYGSAILVRRLSCPLPTRSASRR